MKQPANISIQDEEITLCAVDPVQNLALLILNTEEPFAMVDLHLNIIAFNDQFKNQYFTHFGKEVIKGASVFDYAQEEKVEALKLVYIHVFAGGTHQSELEIASQDKVNHTFLFKYKPAYNEKREIIGAFISATDISEKKRSEQQLITNEMRFRSLVENAGDAIAIIGPDGKPTYVSPSIKNVLGYTEEEAMNLNLFTIVHPGDVGSLNKILELTISNPGISMPGHTGRMLHKDGSWHWYESIVTNMLHDPLINGIVSNFRDITEKTLTAQEKQFEHHNLDALINNTNDMMWSISKEGKMITSNRAFDEMVKYMSGSSVVKGEYAPTAGFSEEQLKNWEQLYARAFSGETFTIIEYAEFPVEFWSEISFYPFKKDDEIVGTACYSRNITERKLFERKLEQGAAEFVKIKNELERSEKSLKEAQAMAQLGSWEADLKTHETTWSDQAYKIFGVKKDGFVPSLEAYLSFIHPDDLDYVKECIEAGNKSLQEYSFVSRIINNEGLEKHIQSTCKYITDEEGIPIRLQGTMHDITESKKSEARLLHEEVRLNQAQEITHVGNWEVNFATNISKWSDEAYRIYGLQPGEHKLSVESWMAFIHPEDLEMCKQEIRKSQETLCDSTMSHRIIRKDGITRHVLSVSKFEFNRDGKPIGLFGIVHDVTEEKLAEENIRTAKERYDIVAKATSDVIWDWDLVKNKTEYNQGISLVFGYKETEVPDRSGWWDTKLHPDDKIRVLESVDEFFNKEESILQVEYRFQCADGSYKSILDKSIAIRDKKGRVLRMIGAMQDITQRKNAEELLRQSNERYDFVAKATNDAIYDWDLKTNKVIRTGDGLEVLFGFNSVDASNDDNFWKKRIHPDEVEESYMKLNEHLKDPDKKLCDMEYRLQKADGSYAYVYDKGYIVRDVTGKPLRMIGATRDITHRKETEILLKELNENLEKRAFELAKSNSELEQFAYIASHDLQEPLRMVTSFLTQLENKYKDQLDDKAKKYIFFATDGAIRMRRTILDLLEYSRVGRQTNDKEFIDLNELVFDAVQLNKALIDEKNAIIDYGIMPSLKVGRAGLQQVFQNLISNGLKYQNRGERPVITIKGSETETHWEFAVSDNGIGIEPQYFEKIFIVFQRLHNKDDYAGTGIGLAICKKIVENHDGKIWVESTYGSGTTFHFTISKNL